MYGNDIADRPSYLVTSWLMKTVILIFLFRSKNVPKAIVEIEEISHIAKNACFHWKEPLFNISAPILDRNAEISIWNIRFGITSSRVSKPHLTSLVYAAFGQTGRVCESIAWLRIVNPHEIILLINSLNTYRLLR